MPESRYRIVITGFGLLTPVGRSAWQTFARLLEGKTLAQRAAQLPRDIEITDLVRATGSVAIAQHGSTDPAVELTERAIREAVTMSGIDPAGLPVFLGTSKGAVQAWSAAFKLSDPGPHCTDLGMPGPPAPQDAALAVALGPHGYLSHHLTRRLQTGPIRHYVAACASSLTALHHARQYLLTAPSHDYAVVATSEAALMPLFIHSYRRLGVLAKAQPGYYEEKPLDRNRQGFVLSEAGAAVVLRRVPNDSPAMPGEIELVDSAIACEAYDLVRSSPTMPALRHIAEVLCGGRTIDLLHPHAPGTTDHDPVELRTLLHVLNDKHHGPPHLYACKGAIGHAMGAAGLSALVLACVCAKARQCPPMPWLTEPLDTGFGLKSHAIKLPSATTHAIFSAGFAGHTAGAVIRHH